MTNVEYKENCIYCKLRHDMCEHEPTLNDCKYFELGRCFTCKHFSVGEEIEGLCVAEDMSGYNCPNFSEE